MSTFFKSSKAIIFLAFIMLAPAVSFAHNLNYSLEKAPAQDVVWYYIWLGVKHIVPFGLDHILFIIALCLLSRKFKTILWQATAFTVAHSITLALSMKEMVVLPASIVEPIIALSIVFVAIENILLNELKPWRIVVVFFFGLVHGLGFASVLNEVGLPPNKFFLSLASFNVGVEIGQILVILLLFSLVILPFGKKRIYRRVIVFPFSLLIAGIALWWTIERM